VAHCYAEGLSPEEFFFHAIGGREGLVDTAIKTAQTGYALRQIMVGIADIAIDQLFLPRSAHGQVVQFCYGGDSIDPVKLVPVKLDYASISSEKFRTRYQHTPELIDEVAATFDGGRELFEAEWQRLCKDRRFVQQLARLPEAYLSDLDDDRAMLPVDIDRLILDAQQKFKCGKRAESEVQAQAQRMHPMVALEEVDGLLLRIMDVWCFDENLIDERRYTTKMLRIALRSRLASKRVIEEHGLSQQALIWLCDRIVKDYRRSLVQPGEAVGAIAAQSNGEPQQQMTLNTVCYHFLFFLLFLTKNCSFTLLGSVLRT
jgi:DNA-directed RNA polymerase II subunit RPB1